jgi:hypothetical protein
MLGGIPGPRSNDDHETSPRDGVRAPIDGAPATGSSVAVGLERLCRAAVAELKVAGTTVTLMSDGHQGIVAASDEAIRSMDDLQFDLGEGPSRDAFASGRPVLLVDLARSGGRWPGFSTAATEAGIGAVYAFPLQLGAVRFGVLTLYAADPDTMRHQELSACAHFARLATELLIDSAGAHPPHHDHKGAERFLEDDVHVRTEVYQAQGMVMVDLGVSLAEALARLRARAFAESNPLNELAADVVAGRRSLPADSEADDDPGDPGPHEDPPPELPSGGA